MRLRRRPRPERVRETLAEVVNRETGNELIAMRRAMHRAVVLLGAGESTMAREILREALQERWWR